MLQLMAEGRTTKEIATLRNSTSSTVDKQRGTLFAKLKVHNAPEAVSMARKLGLLA